MAESNVVTLYDLAKRYGAQGSTAISKIVEMQAVTNDIFQVLPFKECNDGSREKTGIRTKLPESYWRSINKGVPPSNSAATSLTFTCGLLESYNDIDEEIVDSQPNAKQYRLDEDHAHQAGMANQICETILYGDEKIQPAGFSGFGAFYSKPGADMWGKQIVNAGGSTANKMTSLYIVKFGAEGVYGIYPKGTKAGYSMLDLGKQWHETDAATKAGYMAYKTQFKWRMGVAFKDPRSVVRVANIDTAALSDPAAFNDTLIDAMTLLEENSPGKTVILCNRQVQAYLAKLAQRKDNVNLRIDEFGGKKITHFWDIPILRMDSLKNTEAVIKF